MNGKEKLGKKVIFIFMDVDFHSLLNYYYNNNKEEWKS
jgi:hypothetical protein